MAITIQIKGLNELKAAFKRSPGIVKDQIQKAIVLSTALINREAKLITPVSQVKGKPGGRLRAGIRTKISPFRGVVESTVDYSGYVHEGTKRWPLSIPPKKSGAVRQFMKKGAEKAEGKVQAIFQRAINNIAKQLAT